MPILEFDSPGLVNFGPQPQLWEPLRDAGDALVAERAGPDNKRLQADITLRDLDRQPLNEFDERMLILARLAVEVAPPDAAHLLVDTWVKDCHDNGYFHTDPYAVGVPLSNGLWKYALGIMPRDPIMLSVDGPSTWTINGTVEADMDFVIPMPFINIEESQPGVQPTESEVIKELGRQHCRATAIYTGAADQIVTWGRSQIERPTGRYEVEAAPEGHMYQIGADSLHSIPRGVKAGRTLMLII